MADYLDQAHEEPWGDVGYRVLQVTAIAVAAAEAVGRRLAVAERRATSESSAAELRAWRRTEHAAARLRWQPAFDADWLAAAHPLDVLTTFGAAVRWAVVDAEADRARRACEARMRELHPEAMSGYDTLRADGSTPADAFVAAAPRFAEPTRGHAYAPEWTGRRALAPTVDEARLFAEFVAARDAAKAAADEQREPPGPWGTVDLYRLADSERAPGTGPDPGPGWDWEPVDLAGLTGGRGEEEAVADAGLAAADRAEAGGQREVAAAVATPDDPYTTSVDEHAVAAFGAREHHSRADTLTAQALAAEIGAALAPALLVAAEFPVLGPRGGGTAAVPWTSASRLHPPRLAPPTRGAARRR